MHASSKEAKSVHDDHVKKDHLTSQKDEKAHSKKDGMHGDEHAHSKKDEMHGDEKVHSKKDGMHGVKKFFDSFKQDTTHETKDKSEQLNKDALACESAKEEHKEKHGLKNLFGFSKPDCEVNEKNNPSKDSKVVNKDHKDIKDNVKHFFDSFKHDAANQKHVPTLQDETVQSSDMETVHKTHSKESKHGLKNFFDSFVHESSDLEKRKSKNLDEINNEMKNIEDKTIVNKFLDNFRHEKEQKEKPKTAVFHNEQEVATSMKCVVESPKQVKFFSNQEIDTIPDKTKTEGESKASGKNSTHGVKKFFDSFKHETVKDQNVPESPKPLEDKQKDSVHGMKKFFDSFKHEEQNTACSSIPKTSETCDKKQKDNLSAVKKFFDSLKHEEHDSNRSPEASVPSDKMVKKEKDNDMKVSFQQGKEAEYSQEYDASKVSKSNEHGISVAITQEGDKAVEIIDFPKPAIVSEKKEKETLHGVKKFFDSFKHEAHPEQKNTELVKDPEQGDKVHKEKHGVKNFFESFKHETPENKDTKERVDSKHGGIKRSQSFKETTSEKEPGRSVKNFFDFSHKGITKVSSQPHVSFDKDEHIYDFVDTSVTQSCSAGAPNQAGSSKHSEEKHKDSHQSVKKLFDSFRFKDSKPKVTKHSEAAPRNSSEIPLEGSESINATAIRKIESQSSKTTELVSHAKVPDPTTKSVPKSSEQPQKVEIKSVPQIQIQEPSAAVETKHSVLSTIGENILAMKDKVMSSKEVKKKEVSKIDNSKFQEYDLQNCEQRQSDELPGTYKPLSHSIPSQDKYVRPKVSPSTSAATLPSDGAKNSKQKANLESSTPETLYDTCCLRIAVLLRDKALEIVSDQTKTPPQKPPKPSAEAIAKARAASVSKRLQELQCKSHSIGDNIPVGFDGIRFADDETESSCDYKDVENFDYIMDYELINRYKFDNKFDTFSVPSTCSGMTSYYTADTVTLKDETYSDALMETISLTDAESCVRNLSTSNVAAAKSTPSLNSTSKLKDSKKQPLIKIFSSEKEKVTKKQFVPEVKPRALSTGQSGVKKVPPPLPPKPVLTPKPKSPFTSSMSPQENKPVSPCINGLSLSPRLQTKFSKESVATQKRPLMVADVKETHFLSLRQVKSKDSQGKTLKDRKFDTVLKNESLKHIPSAVHSPLSASKSSPPDFTENTNDVTSVMSRKISPQRPPPPIISIRKEDSKQVVREYKPSPPQKPKRDGMSMASKINKEKRTISPPRPPPPSKSALAKCPPRPPPPTSADLNFSKSTDPILTQSSEKNVDDNANNIDDRLKLYNVEVRQNEIDGQAHDVMVNIPSTSYETTHLASESPVTFDVSGVDLENNVISTETAQDVKISSFVANEQESSLPEVSKKVTSHFDLKAEVPKPPPRTRRIRSRTVEIVPLEKSVDSRLRRSQSLSDVDEEKKVSFLNADKSSKANELKSLYTKINKEVKKSPSNISINNEPGLSSAENVSSRPLPAPPPPPRRFRSLDRKSMKKDKETDDKVKQEVKESKFSTEAESRHFSSINNSEEHPETEDVSKSLQRDLHFDSSSLRPPRKKRTEKHRFLSLHGDEKIQKISSFKHDLESKLQRSSSEPLKPDRRLKQLSDPKYDENANVAFPVLAEVHCNPKLDECGNEILELSTELPEQNVAPLPHKRRNPRTKSQSSWYDQHEPEEEPWEMMNWSAADDAEIKTHIYPTAPLRRKSDPGKKIRETSKFYVDVEQGTETLPLVDKETSPLPLDCSEKSVQTSLETLSHGIESREEESEDTDELLNLAQNLQNELKIIINRHKSVSEGLDDDSNTPPLSAASSEKNLEDSDSKLREKSALSVRSSTSDLWPLSSSDESEGELAQEGSSSLTEIARTRKQKKIFYVAQEIMTSEEVFVDALKLLNVDFKAAVDSANKQRNSVVIPDDILSQIFNHLPQLQHLNENLLMELKDRIENWDRTGKIADVIVKMGPFLKLYSWYIHDFEVNLSLLEESKKKYPLFAQVVKEFEMSARCKRLALNHFMLKPIQRIPQYRLLLQEYLHHLSEESPDYQDTVAALQIVSEVANHANESMKQGDNAQKLISIQNSIMGHKEIIKPGRIFIKEGELMKLSRKGMQPRWFVLFNDLLLYLTPVQQGLYRINHELPLTGMKVAIPIQQDYQNEFSIISVTRSFTLAAKSPEERQEWIVALTKSIEENASKRRTFPNARLQQKAQDKSSEDDDVGFVLGRKAPVWIPDARVTMCQLCTSEFTVTFRRHHCRACGKVVCSICSSNRISLPYLGNRIARVCDECHTKLGPGSSACTESGETDSDNQQIAVKSHLRSEHRHVKKNRRNLPSVLKEVCANDQGSTISGYLQKRSGKNWKKDWFVIKDKVLYEYRASEDVAALRSVPLLGYQIEAFSECYENVEPNLLFQLTHPGQAPLIFHADTIVSAQRWVAALKDATVL
ncbi:uncharacterized protein LOC129218921 [Uloborus diversus]|uniref:uncharacterized protein LOC129218921 n=1 Tax=Uloborus diversus TaxID=327109 RepID=UPI002409A227|nr:uncharacterized protein LOC129218921 [Uloborus diversus]